MALTPEEYLRLEQADPWKNEYVDGEMIAMEHPSLRHLTIVGNLICELINLLREGPCVVLASRMRVTTDPRRHYTYPDIVVVCDHPRVLGEGDEETLTNPELIAEVYSAGTEGADRGAKFERYRTLPSLLEYLLVAEDRSHMELFTRQVDGSWSFREWNDPDANIDLISIGCRLKAAGVYTKVTLQSRHGAHHLP